MATNSELIQESRLEIQSLKTSFGYLEGKLTEANLPLMREELAVLKSRLEKVETHITESDKRRWQFVYIFAGAIATLLVTVIVQLVLLPLVKK